MLGLLQQHLNSNIEIHKLDGVLKDKNTGD